MDVCGERGKIDLGKRGKIDLATCLVLSGTWNGINKSWKCKRLFSTSLLKLFS